MTTIIDGTSNAITFPDSTIQNTSAIVSGKVPYTNLPAGSVLQVVTKSGTLSTSTSSSSFVASGIFANITPRFSTSKIIMTFGVSQLNTGSGNSEVRLNVFRNGAKNGIQESGTIKGDSSRLILPVQSVQNDSPATTSAVTYELYFCLLSGTGPAYLQQDYYITLMEVAG